MEKKYVLTKSKIKNGERNETWTDTFLSSIHPIFIQTGRKYQLLGSCFLLSFKNINYLITAQHLFDNGRQILFLMNESMFFQIVGEASSFEISVTKRDGQITKRNADFAIVRLSIETSEQVKKSSFIFPVDALKSKGISREGSFFLAGFIESKTEFDVSSKYLRTEFIIYTLELIIQNGAYVFKLINREGNNSKLPYLNGLSGSPIMYLPPNQNQLFIVGIATEYVFENNRSEAIIYYEPTGLIKNYIINVNSL